jgi:hypothetical protein
MTAITLFEISREYRDAAEKLSELDLDAVTVADTLEGMSGELQTKAQGVIFVARNLEATAAAIKQAEADMAARRKAMENRAAALRRYVLDAMQTAGIHRIECPQFRLSIRDNPGAVEIFEPGLIPAAYMTQPETPPPVPNKAEINAALKLGTDVPGAKLSQTKRLEVR